MASEEYERILDISAANNQLALKLHKLLAKDGKNVFFCPLSLSTALAMLYCGSRRETAEEMRRVFGYDTLDISDDGIKIGFSELLNSMEKDPEEYTLACANTVLSHKAFGVKEEYKMCLELFFKAFIREVDFVNESEKALSTVNEWISNQTYGMIPRLLDSIKANTVMILLNAVYFKGSWLNKFNENSTLPQCFYNNGDENSAKQVEMMHLKEKFPYSERETFKVLQLPYSGGEIAMLILLPNSKNGLEDIQNSLSPEFFKEIKKDLCETKVEVALPKFRLEYSRSLKKDFQGLGLNLAFMPGAHFDAISDSKNLFVSEIVHKAVLEVNEEGSEASGATAVKIAFRCMPLPCPNFVVDHPFLFVIYNYKNDLIMFMGTVNEL